MNYTIITGLQIVTLVRMVKACDQLYVGILEISDCHGFPRRDGSFKTVQVLLGGYNFIDTLNFISVPYSLDGLTDVCEVGSAMS